MMSMEVIGYIAALFIGISLGLIGGGGSILTVPVLVYLFGISPIVATSYSLFVVGSTSLIGSVNSYRQGWIDLRTVFLFGISSIITVYITRKLIIPLIPEIISIGGLQVPFSILTMILFAILMLIASLSMIKGGRNKVQIEPRKKGIAVLFVYGVAIGIITGFLGAGGGFLLIPALVFILRLPMKKAVGSSLLIIALNSLVGFAGDAGHFTINWTLLISISIIAIAGVFIGGIISKKIPAERLKTGFGWFVLVMGIYIIVRETLFH
jgi:uncharacterized protein